MTQIYRIEKPKKAKVQDSYIEELRKRMQIEELKHEEDQQIEIRKLEKIKRFTETKNGKEKIVLPLLQSYDNVGRYVDITHLNEFPSLMHKCSNLGCAEERHVNIKAVCKNSIATMKNTINNLYSKEIENMKASAKQEGFTAEATSKFENNKLFSFDKSKEDKLNKMRSMKYILIKKNYYAKGATEESKHSLVSSRLPIEQSRNKYALVEDSMQKSHDIREKAGVSLYRLKVYDRLTPVAGVTFTENGKKLKKSAMTVAKCIGKIAKSELRTVADNSFLNNTVISLPDISDGNINQTMGICSNPYND